MADLLPFDIAAKLSESLTSDRETDEGRLDALTGNIDPQRQSEALRVASERNIPVDTAYRKLDELKKPSIDFEGMKKDSPSLYKTMMDKPDHAAIARWDARNLGAFERVWNSLGQAYTQSTEGIEYSDLNRQRMDGEITPEGLARINEIKEARKKAVPYFDTYDVGNIPATVLSAGVTSAYPILRAWDEALLGGTVGAVGGAPGAAIGLGVGVNVGVVKESFDILRGEVYGDAIDALDEQGNPIDHDTAYAVAVVAGGAGAILERIGLKAVAKAFPGGEQLFGIGAEKIMKHATTNPAVRKSLGRIGKIMQAGVTESVTELGQEVLALESLIFAGGATDDEGNSLADSRLERYPAAAYQGLVGGAGLGAGGQALDAGVSTYKAARAKAKAQSLRDAGKAISSSDVANMSPETIQELAKTMDGDSGVELSVPADAVRTLFQEQNLSPEQIEQSFPELIEQLNEADATGAEVTLSAQTFVKIGQMEGFDNFVSDIRSAPDEITEREAADLEAEMEAVQEQVEQGEDQLPDTSFRSAIESQLVEAGRDANVASTEASILATALTNIGERAGLSPEEMAARYGIEITNSELGTSPGPAPDVVTAPAPEAKSEPTKKPTSLIQFIRNAGGIADVGGDLKSRDAGRLRPGLINNKAGLSLDDARQMAVDAGYLEDAGAVSGGVSESDLNQLLDAIDSELSGNDVFSTADAAQVQDYLAEQEAAAIENEISSYSDRERGWLNELDADAVFNLLAFSGEYDIQLEHYSDAEIAKMVGLVKDGESPDNAIEQVAIEGADAPNATEPKKSDEIFGEIPFETREGVEETLERFAAEKISDGQSEELRGTGGSFQNADGITRLTQIKSVNNRGTFDPNDPRILFQGADPEDSEAFRKWAGTDDPVIDPDEVNDTDFSGPGPFVLRSYHGTTHDFTVFDASVRGNKGGQFGAVNYFTTSEDDASSNYGPDGPDLTSNVEQLAEMIEQEAEMFFGDELEAGKTMEDSVAMTLGAAQERASGLDTGTIFDYFPDGVPDEVDVEALSKQIAEKTLKGAQEKVLEVYVRTENPFVVGGEKPSWIEFIDFEALERDAIEQVAEDEGVTVDEIAENRDDYEDQIDERRWDIEADTENELIEAVQTVASQHEIDAQKILQGLFEIATEGTSHTALEDALRKNEGIQYAESWEDGEPIGFHLLGEIIQELGFDSIILKDAGDRFTGMNIEPGTAHIHIADEFNANIKSVKNQGTFDRSSSNILEQSGGKDTVNKPPRGFIEFAKDRKFFKITLTGKADLSTFMHEGWHMMLEILLDLEQTGHASEQQLQDIAILRKFAGAQEGKNTFTRDQHEKVARAGEAYLMEGRAPSADLRQAFQRFRAWLVFIYKRMRSLDVELNDDVRGVFDRLVASDEAIAEARTEMGKPTAPLSQDELSLTDAEYGRYVDAWNKAREQENQELDARLMLDAASELKRAWNDEVRRVTDELKSDLEKTDGYKAWRGILDGELKIDRETIPEESRKLAFGLTSGEGMPLDVVAETLGYDSGVEMLAEIHEARSISRDLRRRAVEQTKLKHGHLNPQTLADEALKAVHSDSSIGLMFTEFRAMAEKADIKVHRGLSEFLRRQADDKISGLTQRQLQPGKWRRAELKAAKESATAAANGDAMEAALAKRRQMMSASMYRATVEAQRQSEVRRKKLRPFISNKRRSVLGKAGDIYLDGVDELLEGVSLKQISARSVQKLDRLADLVKAADEADEPLILPDRVMGMLGKTNYADMTMDDQQALFDSVMNIWHLAKLKNKLRDGRQKRDIEEVMVEMAAAAEANLGPAKKPDGFVQSGWDRAAALLRRGRAALVKSEFMFGWFDGQTTGGLMHRMIYEPLAEASKKEYEIMRGFNDRLLSKMRHMPTEQKTRWSAKRTFMGQKADGATIISAALNLGNEGNKEKLLKGYGWTEAQLRAEIDAFMTKADWDMVQLIWDETNTLWPEVVRVAKIATGLPPKKVEASTVMTPFGEYAGGYYPVAYDPNQTEKQFQNQQSSEGMFSNNFLKPKLGDGFINARTTYFAPVLLDLSVLSNHLSEVVHFVTHYEAIDQANKITSHPKFRAIIKDHMGLEFFRMLRPWLQDIARDQDSPAITKQEVFSSGMKHLRGGTSIATMGYNVFTGFKQLLGVTTGLDALKPRYWVGGMSKAWASADMAKNWRFALKESQELEPLIRNFDRDIKMINDAYAKKTAGKAVDAVVQHAFSHIGYFQLAVNVAVWHGAYDQALAQDGTSHKQAVAAADAAVRQTQSSGAVKDLAAIQRGSEASRMISMFYSWFSVLYNRLEDIARQTKGVKNVPKAARRVAVLVFLSAMMEETGSRAYQMAKEALGGEEEDDDDVGYILTVLLKGGDMMVGTVPLLRSFVSVEGVFTPELTPISRVTEDFDRTISTLYDLIAEGEAPTRSETKSAIKSLSVITKKPLYGIYRLADEVAGEKIFD